MLRGGVEKSRPERRIKPMDIDSKQIKGLADSCDFRNAPCENARIKVAGLSRKKTTGEGEHQEIEQGWAGKRKEEETVIRQSIIDSSNPQSRMPDSRETDRQLGRRPGVQGLNCRPARLACSKD